MTAQAPHSGGRWRVAVPAAPHSQHAEREGSRHTLAVSDQEAAIAACAGQQLLGGGAAQIAVVPGGGRAAQGRPRPGAPGARRPARGGHDRTVPRAGRLSAARALLPAPWGPGRGQPQRRGPGLQRRAWGSAGLGVRLSAVQAASRAAQPPAPTWRERKVCSEAAGEELGRAEPGPLPRCRDRPCPPRLPGPSWGPPLCIPAGPDLYKPPEIILHPRIARSPLATLLPTEVQCLSPILLYPNTWGSRPPSLEN